MTKKTKIIIACAAGAAVILAAVLCLIFLGGGEQPADNGTTAPSSALHTVTVQTAGGMVLENVGVYVYTDAAMTDLVWFARTDKDGKISFEAAGSAFTAKLQDVPQGYQLAQSYAIAGESAAITLESAVISGQQIAGAGFDPGDIMYDFTVEVSGTKYTLSQLLAEKQAVVLNFWFEGCQPCAAEFPHMQAAYEKYSDQLEILAMNPCDGDAASVAAYAADKGLTFPVAKVGNEWQTVFGNIFYPTTVVIDRYGMIALVHQGSIPSSDTFEAMFAHFCAADYRQAVVNGIEDFKQNGGAEELTGTVDNPIEIGSVTEFEVELDPQRELYYNLYKVTNMILTVQTKDGYIVYGDKTYEPVDGKISFEVSVPDMFTPAQLRFGTKGEKQTVTVKLEPKKGTQGNPYVLSLGEFKTEIEAGNEQGVYYVYTAEKTGVIRVVCTGSTEGVNYSFTLYNLTSYAYRTLEEDGEEKTLSIEVTAGDQVQFSAGTLPDDENKYPAATLQFNATFEEKKAEQPTDPTEGTQPSGGSSSGGSSSGGSSSGGNSSGGSSSGGSSSGGSSSGGSSSGGSSSGGSSSGGSSSGGSSSAEKTTYTVTVVNEEGEKLSGVTVKLGDATAVTDSNGVATFQLPKDTYEITVVPPTGYDAPQGSYKVTKRDFTEEVMLPITVPEGYTKLYVGLAYNVGAGTTTVTLKPGEVNYFIFNPSEAGQYRFTAIDGTISYWGTNAQYIQDITNSILDYANNKFTISIKNDALEAPYILGITAAAGKTSGKLVIDRIGDPILGVEDQPWVDYAGSHTPVAGFPAPSGTLTRVDITKPTGTYGLELGSDGFYRINGRIVYLDFDDTTYLAALKGILTEGTGIRAYVEQPNGSIVKENYQTLFTNYVNATDSDGRYPLTADLMHILQEYGSDQAWWDASRNGYLISAVPELNPEYAWMYACYY